MARPSWRRFSESPESPEGRLFDLAAISLSSMAVFITLILWFDNAQRITSNCVFKALTIKSWVADPANASLDTSNYLYFPVMALLCRLLDAIGTYPGDPRHQLTIINAYSPALGLCIVYLLVRQPNGRRSLRPSFAPHLSDRADESRTDNNQASQKHVATNDANFVP